MDEIIICFNRLREIIASKRNCLHHVKPLKALIGNFFVLYVVANPDLEREVFLLRTILEHDLTARYEGMEP